MKMRNGCVSSIDPVASSGSSRQLFRTGCWCRLARPLDSPSSGHMAGNHLAWDQEASWSTAWRRQSRAPRRRLPRWGRSPSRWRRPGSASPTLEALSSGRTGCPTSSTCLYFDLKFCFHLRFGIYAQFEHDGHTEIGVLFPGKSFINSTLLLGDSVKTDQVGTWLAFQKTIQFWETFFSGTLSAFPPWHVRMYGPCQSGCYNVSVIVLTLTIIVNIIMISIKVSRLVPESGGSLGLGSKSESGVEKKSEQAATSSSAEKGEEKKCGWVGLIWLMRAIVKDC